MSTFANREDPDEMQHNCCISSGSTLFVKVKKDFQTKNTIFFENYYLTPLDIYNGLSQVYSIKPEGRIHDLSIQRVIYDLISLFSFGKYGKCSKILITFLFLFSNKMDISSARILQKQSDLDLRCLSGPFWKATSV